MSGSKGFNIPATTFTDVQAWGKNVVDSLINIRNGKLTIADTLTLAASTLSSTFTLASGRLGNDSVILFEPLTDNAAAALYSGSMRVKTKNVTSRTITIKHPSNANTDKSFRYIIIG